MVAMVTAQSKPMSCMPFIGKPELCYLLEANLHKRGAAPHGLAEVGSLFLLLVLVILILVHKKCVRRVASKAFHSLMIIFTFFSRGPWDTFAQWQFKTDAKVRLDSH